MKQPYEIVAAIAADSSRLVKEAIVQAAIAEDNTEFFAGVRLAYDALITFGVKSVPEATVDGPGLSWADFLALAGKLQRRELTGHEARDAIAAAMAQATQAQWNGWYRRILIKDLRCGMSEGTVNREAKKAKRSDLMVPVFSCQLAFDGANHDSKLKGRKQIEIKLDGVRVLAIAQTDGQVTMYSRNGKEFHNFNHIAQQIGQVVKTVGIPEAMVFDGEVVSASFQALMRQVQRKSNADAKDATLWLFDMIPLKDFLKGYYALPQEERTADVTDFVAVNQAAMANVQVLESEIVDLDTTEGTARMAEINKTALANKFEGILIKDPVAPYVTDRDVAWLKMKPWIEVTLEVIDFEEGTGKNAGRLGALVCAGKDDGKNIRVNVGSGLTDDERSDIWANRAMVRGQLVEVRADAVTIAEDSDTYSLRFPRFKTFRGFAVGEKL